MSISGCAAQPNNAFYLAAFGMSFCLTGDTRKIFVSNIRPSTRDRRRVSLGARLDRL